LAQKKFVRAGETIVSAEAFAAAMELLAKAVNEFHRTNPLVAGASKEELRERQKLRSEVFTAVLDKLVSAKRLEVTGEQVRAAGRSVVMKDEEAEAKKTIEGAFASAGLKVPALKEVIAGLPVDKVRAQKIVTLLLRDRVLVKLSDELVFHQEALASLRKMVAGQKASGQKTIDVGKFKDMTGVTRKYAIPLLEFLDRERVTRREGDVRVIL
jgi:selenocysteine-specific elongation factor